MCNLALYPILLLFIQSIFMASNLLFLEVYLAKKNYEIKT